ncbi:MAG: hypothetical protein AABZ64_08250 [Nitrospinota bacterium]
MPKYAMAIDLRACIGCHACTIACKSEHDIPIGVWRCWVKEVEKGLFPYTRREFALADRAHIEKLRRRARR